MEEMIEQNLVLSPADIHLLLQILGNSSWNDIPLAICSDTLEERLLNSFVHMTGTGMIVSSGKEKYRLTDETKALLLPLKEPERKTVALFHNCTMILYERCGQQRLLRVNIGEESCRLGETPDGALALLEELNPDTASFDMPHETELPAESFSADDELADILAESVAVFVQNLSDCENRRCSRVFRSNMALWFSALETGCRPIRFEKSAFINWLNQGGNWNDPCER